MSGRRKEIRDWPFRHGHVFRDRNFGWYMFAAGLALLISAPLGSIVGDILFICIVYGPRSYFEEGLRIASHTPYTLSTGQVLSEGMGTSVRLLDKALWAGFSVLCMSLLVVMVSKLKRISRPMAGSKAQEQRE